MLWNDIRERVKESLKYRRYPGVVRLTEEEFDKLDALVRAAEACCKEAQQTRDGYNVEIDSQTIGEQMLALKALGISHRAENSTSVDSKT